MKGVSKGIIVPWSSCGWVKNPAGRNPSEQSDGVYFILSMTKIVFEYNPAKEFDNFRNTSKSVNHRKPTERYLFYLKNYGKLDRPKVIRFVNDYISNNKIDIKAVLKKIEKRWDKVEKYFFQRADKIFRNNLPEDKIFAYLTIDNRCSYSFGKKYFFIHLNINQTNRTIMHELLHWYFWHNGGKKIEKVYGKKIFNDIKESLTVLLNIEFQDILKGVKDLGYPQHQKLRKLIEKKYKQSGNIYETIDHCLKILQKRS